MGVKGGLCRLSEELSLRPYGWARGTCRRSRRKLVRLSRGSGQEGWREEDRV